MKPKINVLRAVTASVAWRALLIATIIVGVALALLFSAIWALAYFTSEWWWLLLIVYVPLLLGAVAIFTTGRFLIKKLYSQQLSREQKVLLNNFTDKIQRLLKHEVSAGRYSPCSMSRILFSTANYAPQKISSQTLLV